MPSDAFLAKQCRAYSSLKGSIFFETQGKTTSGAGGGGGWDPDGFMQGSTHVSDHTACVASMYAVASRYETRWRRPLEHFFVRKRERAGVALSPTSCQTECESRTGSTVLAESSSSNAFLKLEPQGHDRGYARDDRGGYDRDFRGPDRGPDRGRDRGPDRYDRPHDRPERHERFRDRDDYDRRDRIDRGYDHRPPERDWNDRDRSSYDRGPESFDRDRFDRHEHFGPERGFARERPERQGGVGNYDDVDVSFVCWVVVIRDAVRLHVTM